MSAFSSQFTCSIRDSGSKFSTNIFYVPLHAEEPSCSCVGSVCCLSNLHSHTQGTQACRSPCVVYRLMAGESKTAAHSKPFSYHVRAHNFVHFMPLQSSDKKFTNLSKQEDWMLIWSIFAMITGLLWSHLPHIINHHKHLSYFMQLYNRTITQVPVFLYPCDLEWKSRSFKWKSYWRV